MVRALIDIFVLLIVVDAVLSFVPNPEIRRHPVVAQLRRLCDIPQRPIRQLLPPNIPFDPSPIIVILLLRMLGAFL